MTAAAKSFDFDILTISPPLKDLHPGSSDRVTFQVQNTSDCPVRAEAVLVPLEGPKNEEGGLLQPEEWSYWLELLEAPEYDYEPNSVHEFTAQIRVDVVANTGTYKFMLMLTGLEDPDHVSISSPPVSFNVVSPPVNANRILIGAAIVLAVLLVIAGVMILVRSPKAVGLNRKLLPPDQPVTAGKLAVYTLELTNRLSTPAESVVLNFEYINSVAAVWAKVDMEGPVTTHCGTANKQLRCVFNEIVSNQKVTVSIYILPGLKAVELPKPARLGTINLYWKEKGHLLSDQLPVEVASVEPAGAISAAVIPAVDAATVGLPVKISLIAWLTNPDSKAEEMIFTLPQGMRFKQFPDSCKQDDPDDYFRLNCQQTGLDPIELQVVPLQESNGYDFSLKVNEKKGGAGRTATVQAQDLLPSKNNLLFLNGRDEWIQLGFIGMNGGSAGSQTFSMPRKFSASMWVTPLSTEDGQAFLGAHLHSADQTSVDNLFLAGFYNGAIEVNVMGDYHSLSAPKPDEPFHLVIVVDQSAGGRPVVTAYLDGIAQTWQDGSERCEGNTPCQTFNNPIIDLQGEPFNWVIGQDWDPDGSGIVQSDFFHGSISDLRLWSIATGKDELDTEMVLLPPCLNGMEEKCNSQGLLGWWPLAPAAAQESELPVDCRLAKIGQVVSPAAAGGLPTACILLDFGPDPSLESGVRSGGSWEKPGVKFGFALAFDGKSAVKIPEVTFSQFKSESGTVPVTISAWVSVDSLPHRKQILFAEVFKPAKISTGIGIMLDEDGHVAAFFSRADADQLKWQASKANEFIKDEKSMPPGRWVHYAVVAYYDPATGNLANIKEPLLLFRDAVKIKGISNNLSSGNVFEGIRVHEEGFYLGGFSTWEAPFTGRIDEVRIWNRALVPGGESDYLSTDLDRWRQWPGFRFNEAQYWSFDDARKIGEELGQPAWVLSDLTTGDSIVTGQ